MRTTPRTTLLALALLAASGCALDGATDLTEGPVGRSEESLVLLRGVTVPRIVTALQGTGLNGTRLTGQVLDGRWVASVPLDAVTLADGRTVDVRLEGSRFVAGPGRGLVPERHLVGALFAASLDDGSALELRIDDVVRSDERVERDIQRYVVSYATADGWQPLCGVDDAGAPVAAIPLAGRWDYREGEAGGGSHVDEPGVFTFGCDGFVLAKCVAMGYRPWASVVVCEGRGRLRHCQAVSLEEHHQACTRMLRADYCGDGVSFTDDGVLVNAYDGLGLRVDSEEWDVEAEWDGGGALCVARDRIPVDGAPECGGELELPGCGDPAHFAEGTLIVSEVQP